ncbi:hypothetical protein CBR_g38860 [Chara braunii]|uniref:ADF-H domain-containing protein n=1 Tax=Chara braunii TaxID=69332 RepID=A0A388LQP1_CHABU|nr:hypothetical protein CBR_g38860 [Chara braunii]|eukprot:GBG84579.1 hypothetical protein CBR_g38860 [Chara braunii]
MANASTGIGVNDCCKLRFLELKVKKTAPYIIFKIDEAKHEVTVDQIGASGESFEDFAKALPEGECRYAVYDYEFTNADNCKKTKIFFISWCPCTAKVKARMIYAASKERFRRELDGIQLELQATDASELDVELMREKVY